MKGYVIKTHKGYFYLQGMKNPKICYSDSYQQAYIYDTYQEAEQVVKTLESTIYGNISILQLQ